ncbi:MAG: hypothetical protein DRI37_01145 [Chloroflexi bacterium]|nr:MAG: hypothetical protein DRI37_01145 [Chloroflexota bacterium]
MCDSDLTAPQTIATEGGAYVADDVDTGGGDFIGRDKIINYQLDLPRLLAALHEALPADDPLPQQLLDSLTRFQELHARLHEWKELHNCLNDVLMVKDQFTREVERLDAQGEPGDRRALARLWRPVAQKVSLLLDWAATVQHIAAPLVQTPDGRQGPRWAVEIGAARAHIEALLQPGEFDLTALYDATYDFSDVSERHLYLADKQLRDTAGTLYTLSQIILGSMKRERLSRAPSGTPTAAGAA